MQKMWIALGVLGAFILYLVISSDTATTFGMPNSQFAQVALMSAWGALIASAVLPSREQFKEFARNAVIWILMFLVISAGYIFRYDLQDIASRMSAGLVPGSPRTIQSIEGRERVVLSKADGEHFVARLQANQANVTMLVDTGATSIVLTERDAENAGINIDTLNFTVPSQTANGLAYFARVKLDDLILGNISRRNISVLVGRKESLGQSLLGMNFLNSLTAFEFRGDELILTD